MTVTQYLWKARSVSHDCRAPAQQAGDGSVETNIKRSYNLPSHMMGHMVPPHAVAVASFCYTSSEEAKSKRTTDSRKN